MMPSSNWSPELISRIRSKGQKRGLQGLKPAFFAAPSGTAKAVPYPRPFLKLVLAIVVGAALAVTTSCQTAQNHSFLPPAQAQAPALAAASNPPPQKAP